MRSRVLGGDFIGGKMVWWRHDGKPSSGLKKIAALMFKREVWGG